MKKSFVFTALLVAVAFMPASATIINVPADQPNIQAGINISSDGDTVRVAEGTYVENINFSGKNIVVGSWFLDDGDPSYIALTIIDGNQAGIVVSFFNGEDNSAIITGFTIQNGLASYGGGISCYNQSSPTISNNTISGNTAGWGGGIHCDYSRPTISNNTISGNLGWYGGGIYCFSYSPAISNNTITGNTASDRGGGILCWDSSPVITNTIFWGDSAPNGPEIYLMGTSSPVITYCDVQGGWAGDGNIYADPLFVDAENSDFHLMPGSPCIDAGDPSSPYDPDSTRADIGALYFDQQTGIRDENIIPFEFYLSQNYPNPFNASTTISYTLPYSSDITLDIYDILGRKVETLINGKQPAGYHQAIWQADDFSSGMYFYKLQAGNYIETKKMVLLK